MTKKDKIKSFYDDMATQYDMLFQDWLKRLKFKQKFLIKFLNLTTLMKVQNYLIALAE